MTDSEKPLIDGADSLIAELLRVHDIIGRRENASYVAMRQARALGKDYFSAVGSALLTLGGFHAPIPQTYQFLVSEGDIKSSIEEILDSGGRVPGWGSSFERGHPDPVFETLDRMLVPYPLHSRIQYVTGFFSGSGHSIFPNASCYTSAVCIVRGLTATFGQYLFLNGRINAWTSAFLSQ